MDFSFLFDLLLASIVSWGGMLVVFGVWSLVFIAVLGKRTEKPLSNRKGEPLLTEDGKPLIDSTVIPWPGFVAIPTLFLFIAIGPILPLAFVHSTGLYTFGFFEAGQDDIQASNEIEQLRLVADRLQDVSQLSLADLQILVRQIPVILEEATQTIEEQSAEITSLQQSVQEREAAALEAQRVANELRDLSIEQIEAVRFVISEDAQQTNERFFLIGALVSFPIGFIASLIASWTYQNFSAPKLWRGRRKKVVSDTERDVERASGSLERD